MRDISSMLAAVGERLRAERVRLGLNQADFGQIGGVNRNSQAAYEGGKTAPAADYLLKIGAAGADVSMIMTGQSATGALGYLEGQLIEAYRGLRADRREALLTVALAMLDQPPVDLGSLSTIRRAAAQETVHSSGFRAEGNEP